MWLFHYKNGAWHFDQFINDKTRPPYAILSHRWRDPGEVLFRDVQQFLDGTMAETTGSKKIRAFAKQVLEDKLEAFWVDTVCINQQSSAELQEAINSMFKWYQTSKACYVYLDDVSYTVDIAEYGDGFRRDDNQPSEWFERAWTLQELIAPKEVLFFDRNWRLLGTKAQYASNIAKITGIAQSALCPEPLPINNFSIAQRMAWAAGRKATRMEDIAYSLLGIFGVNMPMLYGEGNKAFIRLQQEIVSNTTDQSIFAWQAKGHFHAQVLATDPSVFKMSHDIVPWTSETPTSYRLTNTGLELEGPVIDLQARVGYYICGIVLSCRYLRAPTNVILMQVRSTVPVGHHSFKKVGMWPVGYRILSLDPATLPHYHLSQVEIMNGLLPAVFEIHLLPIANTVHFRMDRTRLRVVSALPSDAWVAPAPPATSPTFSVFYKSAAHPRSHGTASLELVCNNTGMNVRCCLFKYFDILRLSPVETLAICPPKSDIGIIETALDEIKGFGIKVTVERATQPMFHERETVWNIVIEEGEQFQISESTPRVFWHP